VFVAAVMDGLDGRVARLTGTSSEFGVQYDSLADLVSFGMAPALVMYHWSLSALRLDSPVLGRIGWAAAFLYAACAACAWRGSTRRWRWWTSAGSSAWPARPPPG
jgi:CDP-diacylglycerol--serine O-phosphatidyltransferase